ncbi:MAG: nucleotidyltransferase [Pyrinomonadaceae bacterium]
MVEFEPTIKSLTKEKVDFVIIGGLAISVHSTGYITTDLDFCYLRTPENLKRIISAFAPFNPRLRGFSEELPFVWDERTLQNGMNFTLKTTIGDIDMLGEVAGVGSFEAVKKESILTRLYGCDVRVLTLEGLIKAV